MPCDMQSDTYILSLDTLAKKPLASMKNIKLNQAYKAADKLYSCLYSTPEKETTYIHLTRFLFMLDIIYKKEKDVKYLESRYGSKRSDVEKKHKEVREILISNYVSSHKISQKTTTVKEEISAPLQIQDENIFGQDKYITCQQLYEAHQLDKNILVIDVRPEHEFDNSHLKFSNVININEALIVTGLSANKLGEKLENNIREMYKQRDTFEYIVLIDFDTTQDSYSTSRIKILYLMLTEWDYNTVYKHSPYILKGGYIDFIDRYPTYSTNPNVILHHKYSDLDELLDLDTIQYPEEFATLKDDTNRINIETDSIYKEIHDNTFELLSIEKKLLDIQNKFYDPNNTTIKNKIATEIDQMTKSKSKLVTKNQKLNVSLKVLLEKRPRDNIQKKAEIRELEYQIANVSRERRKLIEANKVDETPSSLVPVIVRLPESLGDKPSVVQIPTDVARPQKPLIDRNTKPKLSSYSIKENSGVVGLVNIRNTCYMNSIMQCLRYLPSMKAFFLSNSYERNVKKDNPNLINEVADLIRTLWTTTSKAVSPSDFYKKVTALNPTFKRGHHEDASEFFMFVYDQIFEDTASPVAREKYAEAKYQTLYDRIQYKTSFFMRQFYHQIRTDCICGGCFKKCLKYDIENILMFGVPEHGNCSIEEMYNEFMHTCDISDYYCRNCERKSDIVREFSFQPKVMVFLLKRYSFENGIAEKINVPCEFPLDNFRMGNAIYKLWGVCLHQGGMEAGHYTAVCLNHEENIWYEFNDDSVKPIDINSRFVREKVYMLFYESHNGSHVGFCQDGY